MPQNIGTVKAGNATVAPIRNVALLSELVSRVMNRPKGLPGLGTFYSPSGYGKSFAACFCVVSHRAYFAQVKSVWTRKSFLEAILADMRITPAKTVSKMLDQVCEQLHLSKRPLLIDDAHDIVEVPGKIGLVKDMYEGSQGAIILIGEELLPEKLQLIERVHGRMLDWVAGQPVSAEDMEKLIPLHCQDLRLGDDLKAKILTLAHGSVRRVCVNLEKVREFATMQGLNSINASQYTGELFTGTPPARRG